MPTTSQIRVIQLGRRECGLNEQQYRTLLRNVGGVESCKDLDNHGIEDVMAVLEDLGFSSHPAGPTYWRAKVSRRGSPPYRTLGGDCESVVRAYVGHAACRRAEMAQAARHAQDIREIDAWAEAVRLDRQRRRIGFLIAFVVAVVVGVCFVTGLILKGNQ